MVVGGWQEARGGAIGPKYTDKRLNNSYFVENILEELDSPGEWFMDADALWLYVGTAPTAAGAGAGTGFVKELLEGFLGAGYHLENNRHPVVFVEDTPDRLVSCRDAGCRVITVPVNEQIKQ